MWAAGRSDHDHHSPRGWICRDTADSHPKNHRGNSSVKCHLAGIELAFLRLSWNFLFDLQNQALGVLLHKLTILLYTAKERNEILTDENTWHINNPRRFWALQFRPEWRSGKLQFPSWRNHNERRQSRARFNRVVCEWFSGLFNKQQPRL